MFKNIRISVSIFAVTFASSLIVPAAEPTHQDIAQAAGYKAMFTCSATFNAGKSKDMIAAHELTNIYQSATNAMKHTGDTIINHAEKYVSVTYAGRATSAHFCLATSSWVYSSSPGRWNRIYQTLTARKTEIQQNKPRRYHVAKW